MPVSDDDRIMELSVFAESAGYSYLDVAALKGWLRQKQLRVTHATGRQWQAWMTEVLEEKIVA
jgi:hypothetical protein